MSSFWGLILAARSWPRICETLWDRRIAGQQPNAVATWNAVCLADFGDGGVAFVAQPQIPPRNVNWASSGKWVHTAKVGFEKYFLHKIKTGKSETPHEKLALHLLGIKKLKAIEVMPGSEQDEA